MTAWQCDIAGAIKNNLNGSTDILTTTGGASYLQPSVQDAYFSCDALDMIAIHAYGLGDLTTDALAPYVTKAVNAGKKLIMEEWGICYWDSSNNNCPKAGVLDSSTRDGEISTYFNNIAQAGMLQRSGTSNRTSTDRTTSQVSRRCTGKSSLTLFHTMEATTTR